MGALSTKVLPDTIRSIDSATFTGSYQAVGTKLTYPTRIIKFTNNSTVLATLSWDGTNDHEVLPAGSFVLLDVSSDKETAGIFEVGANTQFYVKGSAGTGLFYISTYYGA
jgi:hypothetical protein